MLSAGQPPALHAIPILYRPRNTWAQFFNGILFILLLDFGCLMVNGFQLFFLAPLFLLSFGCARGLYHEGIRYTKGAFARLLVLLCQLCAPTELSITFERTGKGAFNDAEIEAMVVRDGMGKVVSLNLPKKSVFVANHQMYADWWYAWTLAYFMGTEKDVFIVLKASLKWIPVIGWGMQFFKFIFLARSWATDRMNLARRLAQLGKEAEQNDDPFMLVLYPEGTLISADTHPISQKYADKLGISNRRNMLLPKSTGLHHSLRSLAPKIPSLQLLDATVHYPGVPPMGYGQSYYTLRSIFMDRLPPPTIHIHLRKFDMMKDVPIGDISQSNLSDIPRKNGQGTVEIDIPEHEKGKFDLWLRDLWQDKDDSMDTFLATGSFVGGKGDAGKSRTASSNAQPVRIPLKLREKREFLDAVVFFSPAIAGRILHGLIKMART